MLYEGDAPTWARWARALDHGEPFEFDLPMRTPAVAFCLHWFVPGAVAAPFTAVKLVWCALSAATCAALFVFVASELSTRAAWIAATMLAFSFGSYELATSLDNEAPYALLVVLIAGWTARFVRGPSFGLAIALGTLHGLALLARAEHALLLALLAGWTLVCDRSARVLASQAALASVALLVCAPWIWRSHVATERFNTLESPPIEFAGAKPPWTPDAQDFLRSLPAFARAGNFAFIQARSSASGKIEVTRADVLNFFREEFDYVPEPLSTWSLVSSKGALDFALANDRSSDGGFSRAALSDAHDADPEFAFGRPSHLKLYNHGFAVGWRSIRADFGGWLALAAKKFERFFDGVTLGFSALDLPFGRANRRAPVDLATPLEARVVWRLAFALAIAAGLAIGSRRRAAVPWLATIGCKLAITLLFYGYARQAVSIAPAFCVCAALALDALVERFASDAKWPRAVGLAIAAALFATDAVVSRGANAFEVRPVRADAKIVPAPEWTSGAFETFDEIEIRPR